MARSNFRLGGRSTAPPSQQVRHLSAQQIAGRARRRHVARNGGPRPLLLRGPLYRRDWRLYAKTLGRIFDDLRDVGFNSARDQASLASINFSSTDAHSRAHPPGQLFHCLVSLHGAETNKGRTTSSAKTRIGREALSPDRAGLIFSV